MINHPFEMDTKPGRALTRHYPIDRAHDHLDTALLHLTDAIEASEDARLTRLVEVLDRVSAALADLDRLREAM